MRPTVQTKRDLSSTSYASACSGGLQSLRRRTSGKVGRLTQSRNVEDPAPYTRRHSWVISLNAVWLVGSRATIYLQVGDEPLLRQK